MNTEVEEKVRGVVDEAIFKFYGEDTSLLRFGSIKEDDGLYFIDIKFREEFISLMNSRPFLIFKGTVYNKVRKILIDEGLVKEVTSCVSKGSCHSCSSSSCDSLVRLQFSEG